MAQKDRLDQIRATVMGVITRNTIKAYNTDILLISCKGLSLDGGLFDSDENEADIKQFMAN